MINNLHISLTNLKNESRMLKETDTLVKKSIFKKIYIVGLHEGDLKNIELIDEHREINRISLKSRDLPKNLFFQLIKYMEYLTIILYKYRKKNIRVVNVHALGLLPIGVFYKFFFNVKLIYDAHEYETQTQGLRGLRKKLASILEKVLIPYCDKTIVVSESIADEYKKLYPKLQRPIVVLNTPAYKEMKKKDIFREKFNIEKDTTIFLYQGGLSRGRGIKILLEVFKGLSRYPVSNSKSTNTPVIVFMGYGELENLVKEYSKKYENIYFHEAVTPDALLNYTSSADFGILFYENNCLNHYYCSPNKMFEYLMAEIPVIVSNLYEMKSLVESYSIGVVAKVNTPKGLKDAIKQAIKLDKKELQQNIQKAKDIYNWEEQEKVLLDAYKDVYAN